MNDKGNSAAGATRRQEWTREGLDARHGIAGPRQGAEEITQAPGLARDPEQKKIPTPQEPSLCQALCVQGAQVLSSPRQHAWQVIPSTLLPPKE